MKRWRIALLLVFALPLLGAGSKKGSGDALVNSPLTQFDDVTTINDTQFCRGNAGGGFDCDTAGALDNDDLSDNNPVDLNNVTITDGQFCQGNALSGFDCDQALTNEHLDWTGSVGTVHADNVGAGHVDALTELVLCVGSGTSVIQFDNAGAPTCKVAVPTTITAVADGDILVGQTTGAEFQDKQMSGDATMDKGGVVTLSDQVHSIYWRMDLDQTQVGGTGAGNECEVLSGFVVTNGPAMQWVVCDDSDDGFFGGTVVMPDAWDGGTVTIEMDTAQILASTGGFDVDFEVVCTSSGDDFVAFADANMQAADITMVADDDFLTVTTSPITVNGTTCAGGDFLAWRGDVDAAGTATSSETLIAVIGIKMEYTTTIGD